MFKLSRKLSDIGKTIKNLFTVYELLRTDQLKNLVDQLLTPVV